MQERVMNFGNLPPLPTGWRVIQLDSGHYIAQCGDIESAITVNLYHARRWAFELAAEQLNALPPTAKA